MKRFSGFLLLCLTLSVLNSALALSSKCYACHGEYCNDPFNRDKATVMSCSSSTTVNGRNAENSNNLVKVDARFKDWDSLEAKLWNMWNSVFGTTVTEFVCAKSTYFSSIHQINMTIRRCMPKMFKGTEACSQLSNIISGGYGRVRSCSFCETDLCNSGISLKSSVLALFIVIIFKVVL